MVRIRFERLLETRRGHNGCPYRRSHINICPVEGELAAEAKKQAKRRRVCTIGMQFFGQFHILHHSGNRCHGNHTHTHHIQLSQIWKVTNWLRLWPKFVCFFRLAALSHREQECVGVGHAGRLLWTPAKLAQR